MSIFSRQRRIKKTKDILSQKGRSETSERPVNFISAEREYFGDTQEGMNRRVMMFAL